jgi:large subunit ribosomal protein L13Ae
MDGQRRHDELIVTSVQRLSHEVGWGYKDVVDRLEEKRKIKAQAYHERKVRIVFTG